METSRTAAFVVSMCQKFPALRQSRRQRRGIELHLFQWSAGSTRDAQLVISGSA